MSTAAFNPEAVTRHIVQWLTQYATKAGVKGFVVGVSGGIDSAVTSALCARTGLPVVLAEMPIYQAESQVSRARLHMEQLQREFPLVTLQEIALTSVFDALLQQLPPCEDPGLAQLALANTRARLRMTSLYYLAGIHGLLVAGTGNKVEDFGVGFYTKYGDGGVDLSPIADLYKTEVYALGHYLGVNAFILQAPPTDGLWGDDRTDEDQIGASYPELEWAMEFKGNEGLLSARQREVLAIYRRMNAANRHKMDPIPVCAIPDSVRWAAPETQ
jgi:NAD+ synthase